MMNYVGYRLKRDILTEQGLILLTEHTTLTRELLHNLLAQGYVLNDDDIIFDMAEYDEIMDETVEVIEEILTYIKHTDSIPVSEVQEEVIPIIQRATLEPDISKLLMSLQSKDDYTYRHTLAVGVISNLIGKWIGLDDDQLAELTMGACLHDIGKVKVPNQILNKPGNLTTDEFALMKEHTMYGYEMISHQSELSRPIALIAREHHERIDGSGYPYGIKGEEIHYYSKIVAVADVFHAMMSKRVYHDPLPFFKVLGEMWDSAFNILDPEILTLFLMKMMNSIIGSEVLLTNGAKGRIVYINPFDPLNPVIISNGETYDLSRTKHLNINTFV